MDNNIILIGPSGAGKSTLSKLLATRLGLTALELDDLRWAYYAELGYDHEEQRRIRKVGGMRASAEYWNPFDIHSVERVLADYPAGNVIAFGAGASIYEGARFDRAQQLLQPHLVILLLPSPNHAESRQIMEARIVAKEPEAIHFVQGISEVNAMFLQHPSNQNLANLTIYTKGKSPEQTCDEITNLIQ